jgi:hypothetical protein
MEGKCSGRKKGTILAFTWRDFQELQKPSVGIGNRQANILTWDFQNTKQECYHSVAMVSPELTLEISGNHNHHLHI